MLFPDWTVLNAAIDWLAHGSLHFSWLQVLVVTLVLTHITIASVTIYLHRHSAHRALDLHPLVSHFFRFWLWLTTGQVTKEWTAIHRKHHAKCEQIEDPHSPHVHGIKAVLLTGAELYRKESKNLDTLARFGHGTPDDWIERNLYTRFSWQGVALMLIINLALFGALGLTVWAVQMMWIPVTAAGIINGAAHYWGYRNFEAPDASTNISPWGILIGGEELHNNHHTYPTSAKLSVKPYEFDIGWMYITILQSMGLAKVKKTPPKLAYGETRPVADVFLQEVSSAKLDEHVIKVASRWFHRAAEKVPAEAVSLLSQARAAYPVLDKMVVMREELTQIWLNTSHSREQLAADLQAWCRRAEESGIAALRDFSTQLRAATVKPV